MADISKITVPNGSGTNTYNLKDSEARKGLSSTVKYTTQALTDAQKAQARENIGAAASDDIPTDAVKYTAQSLTAAQKSQARQNIGASDGDYRFLTNTPPLVKGSGTGGNLNGGTGMNSTTTTAKKNSVAYGDVASANGNYSVAFGYFVQALHDYEIALGKLNQSNADTAFSFGDGTSDSDRHNLMELKTDGTLLLNGNAVKTEGGDDNKLWLGTIVSSELKYGFTLEGDRPVSSVQFLTAPSSISDISIYKDFAVGTSSGVVKIYPINGLATGMTLTGTWVKVENCYKMFYYNISSSAHITSLDLSMLDTSEVRDMYCMFASCEYLKSLDLSTFDTSKVINMSNMFASCASLTSLDLSSFDMTNVVAYTDMFGDSSNPAGITTLKTPKINPHDDIPLPRTLYSQDGTAYTNLPVTTGTSIELRRSWT